jgi:hypothetical protein
MTQKLSRRSDELRSVIVYARTRTLALILALIGAGHWCAAQATQTTDDAAVALLQYLAVTGPLGSEHSPICVTLDSRDVSTEFKARLAGTGLQFVPCSTDGIVVHFPIGTPKMGGDLNYWLRYRFFFGVP